MFAGLRRERGRGLEQRGRGVVGVVEHEQVGRSLSCAPRITSSAASGAPEPAA